MVQQVACECAFRGGNGVDDLWCSGGEQNGGDGFGGERHLETVCAVARRSGGSALRICSNCIFFQRVACVRNERFTFEVLQRERLHRSIGGEVCKAEVQVLRVFFGAVHEDDRKRIALVAYGTVGGHQRVVAGGGLHAIRVSVATEQVNRFVHAIAPRPRGENLHAVILHGAEERGVNEGRYHGVIVDDACFGDAELDAVIFAEVFFEPLVYAHEDVGFVSLLLVAPVAFACRTANAVTALVVVGGVEQYAVPVDAAFVVGFAGIPVDVENIKEPHAARLLRFGNFLGEKF